MAHQETLLLAIPDTAQRAACFSALAHDPRRIVRGFGNIDDVIEALDSSDGACLIVDQRGFTSVDFQRLLRAVGAHGAIVTLVLADVLPIGDALALIHANLCDILAANSPVAVIAARAASLLPLAVQLGQRRRNAAAAEQAIARLSPRERSVLTALAEGCTSKDIARTLGVSPRTIEVHRASIMRRTGTAALAELLRLYFLVEFVASAPTARLISKAA